MTDAAVSAPEAPKADHSRLQWRILIGFVAGLVGGLLAYTRWRATRPGSNGW